MVRVPPERVLLIGDSDREIYTALAQAMPAAEIRAVPTLFDGIAELVNEKFSTVIAAAEPIERRPEAAVRTLRELSGNGRLLLFGHPTLEPLSQKMLEFGCDDYVVTPVTPAELLQTVRPGNLERPDVADPPKPENPQPPETIERASKPLEFPPLLDFALDALVQSPQDSAGALLRQLNAALPPEYRLIVENNGGSAPAATPERIILSLHPSDAAGSDEQGHPHAVHLTAPADADRAAAARFLEKATGALSRVHLLQERHAALQRLAVTDDLTGLYNGRYFRHFLTKIIDKARSMRFLVTVFLFDIDNFKRYNDEFGHAAGDEILKQTGALMRRCVRDHDLVARISGDEFAVVFWDKEGPRQPRDPKSSAGSRAPQEPMEILERFRRLLSGQDFSELGPGGRGILSISGGLAVYPYDAQDPLKLIEAADHQLMFGAKRAGRNSIHLVGGQSLPPASPER